MTRFSGLSLLALLVTTPLPAWAQWGNLEGRVIATGEIVDVPPDESRLFGEATRGVANVFVYLTETPADVHPDLAIGGDDAVDFAMRSSQFIPHAMIVRTGQTMRLINNDPMLHNVHTFPFRNESINYGLSPNNQIELPEAMLQQESRPVQVKSDIQPQMSAYWMVVDHPYATVTDAEGRFRIENLPAGTHTISIWHERVEYLERDLEVVVIDGETSTLALEVPVQDFFEE